jgi:hypothetical protein
MFYLLTGSSEEGETFDRYADSDQIYGVLARETGDGLAALLARLAGRYGGTTADRHGGTTTVARPGELLLMARFLQAFPQLCGSVRTCLSGTAAAHAQSNSAANAQCQPAAAFSRLEALFLEASCRMFNLWIGFLLAELERQLGASSRSDSNSNSTSSSSSSNSNCMDLLGFFPAWDKISVQGGMAPAHFFSNFPAINLMLLKSSLCFILF